MNAVFKLTKKDTNKFIQLIKDLLENDNDTIEVTLNTDALMQEDDTTYLNSSKKNKTTLEKSISNIKLQKELVHFDDLESLMTLSK